MSRTSALIPYAFEGHRIRVSTDDHGEAWFVVADACAALAESPLGWALAIQREEEHCLLSEEGPGHGGLTLALISEGGLLRRLLESTNPSAGRMRRWLTHALLPAIARGQQGVAAQAGRTIAAIRRQTATDVLRKADEIIQLTGVSHADALLGALEQIQRDSVQVHDQAVQGASASPRHGLTGQGAQPDQMPMPQGRRLPGERPGAAWLTAEQLADRLDRTLRGTNQQLAASGLQLRNEDDDWQLTDAGRDWAVALPLCCRGQRRQQILWDPAVVALLQEDA
ncbi:MAG: Bro-N domain-containing protein [Cyanobium sp.]|jgi:prophage antirepressor-like protein